MTETSNFWATKANHLYTSFSHIKDGVVGYLPSFYKVYLGNEKNRLNNFFGVGKEGSRDGKAGVCVVNYISQQGQVFIFIM